MKTIYISLIGIILSSASILAQSENNDLKVEANQLMKMGRYGEAINLLDRFISSNPQNIEGYLLRGTCYEKRGNYEFAVSDYRTAKKIAPSNIQVTNQLNATVDTWYKLLFNKIEGYKREIAIHPDRAVNYLEIGKAYKNLGEWKEAEIWYDEYLKRAEPSTDDVLRYTEILAKNNQLTKGEQILKRYVSVYPDDHRVWSRYGYFLYWLGKNRKAADAFEKALVIRPFFKEALDGLDLTKGKGYVYTINDTTAKYQYGLPLGSTQYIIDKLFAKLKRNPGDDESRIELINQLIKANRFEEALNEFEKFSDKYFGSENYNLLYKKVLEHRSEYFNRKIQESLTKLESNPNDLDAILTLAKYYSYQKKYLQSKEMFERYLSIKQDDDNTRYLYAQILVWNDDLCLAKDQSEILISNNAEKIDYQILNANIYIWLNKNLEQAEILFNNILISQPDNRDALFGLAHLSLQKNNISKAEEYLITLLQDKKIPLTEIDQLKKNIELNRIRIKEEELFSYLENARQSSFDSYCYDAVNGFEKYFEMGGTNKEVYFELANAYYCINMYDKAISIYDSLISDGFDEYEIQKQRAKMIFWSGDSIASLREFRKLNLQEPEDAEVKIYLGDNYVLLKQFDNARIIYNELLNESPESHIIKMRMNWLGPSTVSSFSFDTFPTYVLLSPQGNHFTDNTKFKYSLLGTGLEVGVTNFLSVGISGFRGSLLSEFIKINFNNLKGSAFLRFNENVKSSVSFGQTYFTNNLKENIFEASFKVERNKLYSISLFYNQMDAVFILYSPFLVANRLTAGHAGFNGEYNFKNGLLISGKYTFVDVSDGNNGSNIQLKLGKKFQDDINAGYEYYYYTFSENTELYWSPENFEAHSLWADFNLVRDSEIIFTLGGKIGIIPENDFLLREFY
ncbi:MAG: tetratricopeptide repeat protein, partial [Ignavibacteriaceae bacterium]